MRLVLHGVLSISYALEALDPGLEFGQAGLWDSCISTSNVVLAATRVHASLSCKALFARGGEPPISQAKPEWKFNVRAFLWLGELERPGP